MYLCYLLDTTRDCPQKTNKMFPVVSLILVVFVYTNSVDVAGKSSGACILVAIVSNIYYIMDWIPSMTW